MSPYGKRNPEVEEILDIIDRYIGVWFGEDVARGAMNTMRFGINFVIGAEPLLLLIRKALLTNSHVDWVEVFNAVNMFINMEPNGDLKRALFLTFFDRLYKRLNIKLGSILGDEALERYNKALKLHDKRQEREGWNGKDAFPQKVLVTGASHAGTTLAAAIIRASGQFDFYLGTEDRDFFTKILTPRHGAKLATDNIVWEDLSKRLEENKDLYILFSIRHPVDIALSHIFRARPREEGGDSWDGLTDELATVDGACYRVEQMFILYTKLLEYYHHRTLIVNMEDTIRDLNKTLDNICSFLFIDKTPSMEKPWEYIVHKFMGKRYNKMDTSQIDIYKRWETVYGGFYADKKEVVVELCNKLKPIAEFLGYELEDINGILDHREEELREDNASIQTEEADSK